jgi:copper ion binding protein
MNTVTFSIPNISCNHCVHTITTEVGELEGVSEVRASFETKQATVVFDTPATQDKIVAVLKEINYPPLN